MSYKESSPEYWWPNLVLWLHPKKNQSDHLLLDSIDLTWHVNPFWNAISPSSLIISPHDTLPQSTDNITSQLQFTMGNEPGGNIQQSGGIISSSSESSESPIPLRSNSRLRSNGGNSGGIPNEINISDSDKHNGDANSIRRISASAPASPTAGRADMDIHRNGGVTVAHHTPSTSGSPNPNLLNPERGLGPLAATTGGHHPQYQPLVPVPVPMTNSASSPPGDPNQAVPSRDVDVSSGTGSTERFLRELSANSSQVEEHNFRISGSPRYVDAIYQSRCHTERNVYIVWWNGFGWLYFSIWFPFNFFSDVLSFLSVPQIFFVTNPQFYGQKSMYQNLIEFHTTTIAIWMHDHYSDSLHDITATIQT